MPSVRWKSTKTLYYDGDKSFYDYCQPLKYVYMFWLNKKLELLQFYTRPVKFKLKYS